MNIILCLFTLVNFQQPTTDAYPGKQSDYHGCVRNDFTVDGCPALLVVPKTALPGKPWLWRAEFFDAFPGVDLALLEKGFHLAYINVGNTFGVPSAIKHWEPFYNLLTRKVGLSRKPVLEGMSRGGLYMYRWAADHPNRVGCLFGDAAVCDFKSWPGGKGTGKGSPGDWKKLQQDYGFASEEEALSYKDNPVDRLKAIVRARIPIIHIAGDADDVVPIEENTLLLKRNLEKIGGKMELIVKKGVGHHPHGLPDPAPVVEFILKSVGSNRNN